MTQTTVAEGALPQGSELLRAQVLTTGLQGLNDEWISEGRLFLATSEGACHFIFWEDKRRFSLSNPTFIINLIGDHARTDIYHGSFK